ncbi:MAG: exopolysaccharide biosynthesis polyprenyl glycosylphosphotransferase [Candidatus Pacebacteria bacterium]|nr:exopolysaccharide biosynthesis polyprenyl glycosylphosphotransferase [Candidatus Paceibacterota bacterium]
MQEFESRTSGLLFSGDMVAFIGSLLVTLLIRYQEIPTTDIVAQHLGPFSMLFVLWAAIFLIAGLYDQYVSFDRRGIPRLVLKTQFVNMLLAGVLFFVLPLGITPKTNLVIYLFVSTLFIVVWRLYLYPAIAAKRSIQALVLGSGPEAAGVMRVLERNPYFKQVEVQQIDTQTWADAAVIGKELRTYVSTHDVEMIVADMNTETARKLASVFFELAFTDRSVRFFSLPEFYEQLHHRIPPSLVGESWILEKISVRSPHYAYSFLKRLSDICGALVLMVPNIIIFPLVIAAIKLQDGGPIFYRSERVGQFNKPIHILKFRTMSGMDSGTATLDSTHVVTRLGMFLRKTRIDELPQLWNILRGDISFIGPRPEMPGRAQVYMEKIPYYNMRHLIKPGLSGWAQINHFDVPRNEVDVEKTIDKLSFDLYYLRHRSFFLDMEIILKTVNAVLSRTGT